MRGLEEMKTIINVRVAGINAMQKNATRTAVTRKDDVKNTKGKACQSACVTMEEHKHEFTGLWFYARDDAAGAPGASGQSDGSS